jgi:hypothetical protein
MDLFLVEGMRILHEVGLSMLQLCQSEILQTTEFGETFILLQNLGKKVDEIQLFQMVKKI